MDWPNAYFWLARVGIIGTIGLIMLGVLGMSGCTLEGDTYSGTVVKVDCGAATSAGGNLNCGSGDPHDEHWTDNRTYE
jgi:hypothetical protein